MGVSLAPPALKYENRKLQSMILRMVNESLPHRVVAIVSSGTKAKTNSHHNDVIMSSQNVFFFANFPVYFLHSIV